MNPHVAQWLSFVCFSIAGLFHIGFFYYESIVLQKSSMNSEVKLWALNQGVYNLCLAVGTFVGLYFILQKMIMMAGVLIGFCGLSMMVAGITLWFSAPRIRKFSLLQILPPLFGFIFLYFHVRAFIS